MKKKPARNPPALLQAGQAAGHHQSGKLIMKQNAKKELKTIRDLLWALPIRDYLMSDAFTRFAQQHELWDQWREYLRVSEDRSDLSGDDVPGHAFLLFLDHMYHRRPAQFLHRFTGLLHDFSRGISCNLPVDAIRTSLLRLGYPAEELDRALFVLRVRQEPVPEPAGGCCTPGKKVIIGPRKKG